MKYILDFDRTLFNSPACYQYITEQKGEFEFTAEALADIEVCQFLYDDVISWLNTESKADLYILTAISPKYGPSAGDFQREKLFCSQVVDAVKDVVFMEGLKGEPVAEIAKQFPPHEPLVFVDDRIEQCLSVKSAAPEAVCCLMVRDPAVVGEVSEVQGIKIVHCLADVDAIIEEL